MHAGLAVTHVDGVTTRADQGKLPVEVGDVAATHFALEDMFRLGTFDTNYVKHFQAPWLRVEAPADARTGSGLEKTQRAVQIGAAEARRDLRRARGEEPRQPEGLPRRDLPPVRRGPQPQVVVQDHRQPGMSGLELRALLWPALGSNGSPNPRPLTLDEFARAGARTFTAMSDDRGAARPGYFRLVPRGGGEWSAELGGALVSDSAYARAVFELEQALTLLAERAEKMLDASEVARPHSRSVASQAPERTSPHQGAY